MIKSPIQYLNLEDFDIIVLAIQKGSKIYYLEDIPPFNTRYPGVLESIIGQVQQSFYGFEPYPTLESKASWMFYCIIKNHPFVNGNKRIAVISLFAFLTKNYKMKDEILDNLSASFFLALSQVAIMVAVSKPGDKDEVCLRVENVIKTLIENLFIVD